jgi:hypothetical protein
MPALRALLVLLHDVGAQLAMSSNRVEHYWGLHLLEDWRGLELLAHRAEVVVPTNTPGSVPLTPTQAVVKDAAV